MIKKITLLILVTLIALSLVYIYEPPIKKIISDSDIKENVQYKKIELTNIEVSDKTILNSINNSITKIFWIDCTDCYDMSQVLKLNAIKTYYYPFSIKEESDFKRDAEMYFLVKKFSEKDESIYELFEYYKKEKDKNKEKIIKFISNLVSKEEKELYLYLESEELKIKINDANKISNELNIVSVPTIIVKGNMILMDNIKDNEDIIKVIKYLNERG